MSDWRDDMSGWLPVSLASAEDLSAGVPPAIQKGETTTMSDVTIVATGLGFPEGPVACADGSIVLTEIRNNRCSRVTRDGQVSLFSATGGGPNGLAIGPDGAFYLCNNGGSRYVEGTSMGQGPHPDYKFGYIQRINAKTGECKTLYTECNGHKLSAPNDIVFDVHGGFYFTDLGKRYARHRDHGGLYYALPDGSKIVELAFPDAEPQWLRPLAGRQDPLRGRHGRGPAVGLQRRGTRCAGETETLPSAQRPLHCGASWQCALR